MKKLLIIEDEEEIAVLVEELFMEEEEFEVLKCVSGEEALNLFRNNRPDVLLLDIKLKGFMSGAEVLQKVREIDKNVPVVVFTGYGEHDLLKDMKRYGFSSLLEKGCGRADVREAVESALKGKGT